MAILVLDIKLSTVLRKNKKTTPSNKRIAKSVEIKQQQCPLCLSTANYEGEFFLLIK
jgi:hypothetical protein